MKQTIYIMPFMKIIHLGIALTVLAFAGCETPDISNIISETHDMPDTPPSDIPDNGDAVNVNSIKWLGKNYSNAKMTANLIGGKVSNHRIQYQPGAPSSWPTKTVKVKVQAITCIFYERNGKIIGGKFDWARPNQTTKGTENIHNGYNGHSMPTKGTPVYLMLVSVDGKERTNIVKAMWE